MLPGPIQVFIGGTIGGALRLGLDRAFSPDSHSIPWDVVAINVIGSFALGLIAAQIKSRGGHPWFPLVGPGLLSGFTTFSTLAALHWTASTGTGIAAGVLALTLAGAVAGAAWGWKLGQSATTENDLVENIANHSTAEGA